MTQDTPASPTSKGSRRAAITISTTPDDLDYALRRLKTLNPVKNQQELRKRIVGVFKAVATVANESSGYALEVTGCYPTDRETFWVVMEGDSIEQCMTTYSAAVIMIHEDLCNMPEHTVTITSSPTTKP